MIDTREIYKECCKIIKPYIKEKIMGPFFFSTLEKAINSDEIIFTKSNENIIAFLQWRPYKKEEILLLNKMAVKENMRGQNIGSEILKRFQIIAKEKNKNIKLRVAKINIKGIDFYKKHGFNIIEDKYSSDIVHTMFWSSKW